VFGQSFVALISHGLVERVVVNNMSLQDCASTQNEAFPWYQS
jgi:hypothetical protein